MIRRGNLSKKSERTGGEGRLSNRERKTFRVELSTKAAIVKDDERRGEFY